MILDLFISKYSIEYNLQYLIINIPVNFLIVLFS